MNKSLKDRLTEQFPNETKISVANFLKVAEFEKLEKLKEKKTIYIDMDNVLVDFRSAFKHYDEDFLNRNENKDEIEGIFFKMEPMKGSISAVKLLSKHFNVYILSTAPWENPSAWSDKLIWIKKYLPKVAYKKLILTHNKNLNVGDYLIDDRINNGVLGFNGEHIHFGTEQFPNWKSVTKYILNKENIINKKSI